MNDKTDTTTTEAPATTTVELTQVELEAVGELLWLSKISLWYDLIANNDPDERAYIEAQHDVIDAAWQALGSYAPVLMKITAVLKTAAEAEQETGVDTPAPVGQ